MSEHIERYSTTDAGEVQRMRDDGWTLVHHNEYADCTEFFLERERTGFNLAKSIVSYSGHSTEDQQHTLTRVIDAIEDAII